MKNLPPLVRFWMMVVFVLLSAGCAVSQPTTTTPKTANTVVPSQTSNLAKTACNPPAIAGINWDQLPPSSVFIVREIPSMGSLAYGFYGGASEESIFLVILPPQEGYEIDPSEYSTEEGHIKITPIYGGTSGQPKQLWATIYTFRCPNGDLKLSVQAQHD